jgi:hypothetical protein
MLKTRPAKEVIVRMLNEIGALDRMAKAISDKGIDILAVSAWVEGAHAIIRLVTDDTVRVMDTLRAQGHEVRQADVLMTELPHKPGMLRRISETLAHGGIDIHHLYATAALAQPNAVVVFTSANNDRAMVLLNAAAE